jgi:hypothetical protein
LVGDEAFPRFDLWPDDQEGRRARRAAFALSPLRAVPLRRSELKKKPGPQRRDFLSG